MCIKIIIWYHNLLIIQGYKIFDNGVVNVMDRFTRKENLRLFKSKEQTLKYTTSRFLLPNFELNAK